jgi:hypothetical protein
VASHHQLTLARPRTLAHVLLDLREARRDLDDALADDDPDAEDRATEADNRIDTLRDEFERQLKVATGLSVEQVRDAYSQALL